MEDSKKTIVLLLLITCLSLTMCINKDYFEKLYEENKNNTFEEFYGWRIEKREDSLLYLKYNHFSDNDTITKNNHDYYLSLLAVYKEGKWTFNNLSESEDTEFKKLASYYKTNTEGIKKVLNSIVEKFNELEVKELSGGYKNPGLVYFMLNNDVKVIWIAPKTTDFKDYVKGYHQIDDRWYFKEN